MSIRRIVVSACLVGAAGLAVTRCSRQPESAPVPASDVSDPATPVLSVKELMEHIVDPTADWIFDAAVVDVSPSGTIESAPKSDEDWLKVERGALLLAESANLLKMRRAVAPAGVRATIVEPGKPSPELEPEAIEAMIEKDRPLWNKHADGLRQAALDALPAIRAHDADKLFEVGEKLDNACESCHLEYWYPGDKALVLENRQKVASYGKPAK